MTHYATTTAAGLDHARDMWVIVDAPGRPDLLGENTSWEG
jgi:hypothetical protein